MAGFKEIRIPDAISYGAIGGLNWLTRVVEVESGHEYRDQVLVQPRGRWDVSYAARLPAAYEPLRAFFNNVRGRAYGFRFKDWTDFAVASADSQLVAIDSTHKQLAKRYTSGAETFDRTLKKIVSGTFSATGGSGLSLDYNTGILTFSVAPSAFTCEFDVPARFDTDEMRAEAITRSGGSLVVGWSSIPIIAIRV